MHLTQGFTLGYSLWLPTGATATGLKWTKKEKGD
jgi:hypothetical protein